jgi:hypothetical protein
MAAPVLRNVMVVPVAPTVTVFGTGGHCCSAAMLAGSGQPRSHAEGPTMTILRFG